MALLSVPGPKARELALSSGLVLIAGDLSGRAQKPAVNRRSRPRSIRDETRMPIARSLPECVFGSRQVLFRTLSRVALRGLRFPSRTAAAPPRLMWFPRFGANILSGLARARARGIGIAGGDCAAASRRERGVEWFASGLDSYVVWALNRSGAFDGRRNKFVEIFYIRTVCD